jgi:hypothetical protein
VSIPKVEHRPKYYSFRIVKANGRRESLDQQARVASAARAASLCAGHAQQFGGESPLPNLMEVKG